MPAKLELRWERIIKVLRARPMAEREGRALPNVVEFSPEAKAAWIAWFDGNVEVANGPDYAPDEHSVDGKLENFAARCALILHLLGHAGDGLDGDAWEIPKEPAPIPHLDVPALDGALRL